jgi:hypothetical protein
LPTTRPGYVWSGTEWIAIGQEAVVAPVKYQATEPSSPATGDIWIDSDDEVPGITSSLNYRWRKIATGGETSLSGNDASGLPLAYNPGYEQVYLNGVLQYRGSDYTATTGNTITGLTALVASDTIEVLSFVTAPIGDTYGQAAADARFAPMSGATLQTQLASVAASQTISSTSYTALTNLSVSITPKYATSKVLITVSVNGYTPNSTNAQFAIYRNGVTQLVTEGYVGYAAGEFFHNTMYFLDSPNTTSTQTYQVFSRKNDAGNNTFYTTYGDAGGQRRSTIMVQEIAA